MNDVINDENSKGLIKQGTVVSTKMSKTIVVRIDRRVEHPLYKKVISRSTKVCVHDDKEICKEGDMVLIAQGKPLSKRKSWVLLNVIEKAS